MLSEDNFVRTTLISGDSELCKSFLFEAAIAWAKEGEYVYYFSSKKIESSLLSFHDRSEPSADALKLITFMSVGNYEELASQLVNLHTFRRTASIVLLDDLDVFAGHPGVRSCSREVHVARMCALVLNAALACSKVRGKPVQVCGASFSDGDYAPIYRKYFDNRWELSTEVGDGDSQVDRRVWLRRADGTQSLEFCKLDDAVLALRRVFVLDNEAT